MIYKFTTSSEKAMQVARESATQLGHNYIGTEHLLYGLAKEENGVASKVLKHQNVMEDNIIKKIEELIGSNTRKKVIVLGFTPRTKKVIENAYVGAKKSGSDYIGTEHLLLGILKESDSIAMRILESLQVKSDSILSDISDAMNEFDMALRRSGRRERYEQLWAHANPQPIQQRFDERSPRTAPSIPSLGAGWRRSA